jgi:O-antigen/teichoic acid export membrane protein
MSALKKTFIAILCGRGLTAIRQIVAVPILIKCWGVEYYGQWLVLSAIPTFLSMSNLGLGTSAAVSMAMKVAAKEDEQAATILATVWTLLLAVLVIVLGGAAIYTNVVGFGADALPDASMVLLVMIATLLLRMIATPLTGWWNGKGEAPRNVFLWNFFTIGETLLLLVIPMVGGFALMVVTLTLGWLILWFVFYLYRTAKAGCNLWKLPGFKVNRAAGGMLLTTGMGHQLSPLWQAIYFQGSILLSSALFGPVGAAAWGAARVFTRAGNQLLDVVSQSLGVEFQKSFGTGDIRACRTLHALGLLVSVGFSATACAALLFPGKWIFDVWTHRKFDIPWPMWTCLCLSLLPFAFWQLSGEVQRSANKPWAMNVWGIVASLLSLLVMWMGKGLGLTGLAIGALAFESLMALFILPTSAALLGQKLPELFASMKSEFRSNEGKLRRNVRKLVGLGR